MATHLSILSLEIPWTESLADYSSWVAKELERTEQLNNNNINYSLSSPTELLFTDWSNEHESTLNLTVKEFLWFQFMKYHPHLIQTKALKKCGPSQKEYLLKATCALLRC